MKRLISLILMAILLVAMLSTQIVYASMPENATCDIAGTITFDNDEDIAVLSEVMDIKVFNDVANITATYIIVNTSCNRVTVPIMFLSPNMNGFTYVAVDNIKVRLDAETHYLYTYDDQVLSMSGDSWDYIVSQYTDIETEVCYQSGQLDAITFDIAFHPNEQLEVVVSYNYTLGIEHYRTDDYSRGEIFYYLTPTSTWQDFHSLTINLFLEEDMSDLVDSNIQFVKTSDRTYQYRSNSLPEDNLHILTEGILDDYQGVFDEFTGWFLLIFGLPLILLGITLLVLGITLIIVAILLIQYYCKKRRAKK